MFSSNPNSCHPRRGEQLEMELIIDRGYMRRAPKSHWRGKGSENFQVGKHIYIRMTRSHLKGQAPMFRNLPDLSYLFIWLFICILYQ